MFVFYDIETTGKLAAFDQILQFAAVLTDDGLNERDRYAIRCRLLPDVVPSPEALLANRIAPDTLTDDTLPSHYEAIREIRAKLTEWSPAVFIGYNSIQFDEEFLRQAFYQTLHPAYITNTRGNARGDLMRVIHAVSVYEADSIVVPLEGPGEPTYRLGDVARANGYAPGALHEAMADVEATLYLARHAKRRAPKIWERMTQLTRKDAVIQFLTTEEKVSFTKFVYNKPYSWLATYCGRNTQRGSDLAVFDLQFNPDGYLDLPADELSAVLNDTPKAIRIVPANRQPILMPAEAALGIVAGKQVAPDEIERRVKLLRRSQAFRERVGEALSKRYGEEPPSPHVEQRIYRGFPSPADERLMGQFHEVDWGERLALTKRLNDSGTREMAERLVYFEKPEVLPKPVRARYDSWVAERTATNDPNVPWTTVPKAMREADELLTKANREDTDFLKDVKAFLKKLAARYSQ